MSSSLEKYATELLCLSMEKMAFIRRMPNGKYRVISEKGKNLGEYSDRNAAKHRLHLVEWFKKNKGKLRKKKASEEATYSAAVRQFRKDHDDETVHRFQHLFKILFDRYYVAGHKEPEREALQETLRAMNPIHKAAAAIEMGDPNVAGQKLSEMVRFLLRRIDPAKQGLALQKVRRRIFQINENEIAQKHTPPSSSMGAVITLIKNILLDHDARYIRDVLNAIVRNL